VDVARGLAGIARVAFPELSEGQQKNAHRIESRRAILESVYAVCEAELWSPRGKGVLDETEVYQRQRPGGNPAPPAEPPLTDFLRRLLEEHWAAIGPLFGGRSAGEAADEVMRYRNYVVHRDSDLGSSPNYAESWFWLTRKLLFLMKACLPGELGIPPEGRVNLFRQNQMYIHMLGLA
jgi:hypothetical protein